MASTEPTGTFERTFADLSDNALSEAQRGEWSYWHAYAPQIGWSDLLKSDRVFIVSEAGSGKTYECQHQKEALVREGRTAFYVELNGLADTQLHELLSPQDERRFQTWKNLESDVAIFFLDSIDELKITQKNFRQSLINLQRAIDGLLRRVKIVITTRPIVYDENLVEQFLPVPPDEPEPATDDSFADIAMGQRRDRVSPPNPVDRTRRVGLLPLTPEQRRAFVVSQGVVDADVLLAEITKRDLDAFVRRPLDLIGICSAWREKGSLLPYCQQIQFDIDSKLKPRTDGHRTAERDQLPNDRAFEGACRLALAAVLTKRLNFRHSGEPDRGGDLESVIDPSNILTDWSQAERTELLERPLFGFASYGRVRFHHRSVIDYLAAQRLSTHIEKGASIKSIKRLIFTETAQGTTVIRPKMGDVAAWLAIRHASIFNDVCHTNPHILLNSGDPSALSVEKRASALVRYVELYGQGGWRGLRVPHIQVHRFASPALGATLRELWAGTQNEEVRELLLNLAVACGATECCNAAMDVALSDQESHSLRALAVQALAELNAPALEGVLKSLASEPDLWPEDVTARALPLLFPKHLTGTDFVSALSRITERGNKIGHLDFYLPQCVEDIPVRGGMLQELRGSITDMVRSEVTAEPWGQYHSSKPFIVSVLAAICVRIISNFAMDIDLASSIVLTLRVFDRNSHVNPSVESLRKLIRTLPATDREIIFWQEDEISQSYFPRSDSRERLIHAQIHSSIGSLSGRDSEWIQSTLLGEAMPLPQREMMLWACISRIQETQCNDQQWQALADGLVGCPELQSIVAECRAIKPHPDYLAHMQESECRELEQKEVQKRQHAEWKDFSAGVRERPDEALSSERVGHTLWNIYRAMAQIEKSDTYAGWNREFLVQHFGAEIAEKIRNTLSDIWLKFETTLWGERPAGEKNHYSYDWAFGLSSLAALAEDRRWTAKLTPNQAQRACRYAAVAMGGFPAWLNDLIDAFPDDVDAILGVELSAELLRPADVLGMLILQHVSYGSEAIRRFFLTRLMDWLFSHGVGAVGEEYTQHLPDRLEAVLEICISYHNSESRDKLLETAKHATESFPDTQRSLLWLSALFKLNAKEGCETLLRWLNELDHNNKDFALTWFANLFGNRVASRFMHVDTKRLAPQMLLGLVKAAYTHVPPSGDREHFGPYAPDLRDHAEHARNALLNDLLNATGHDGWLAKLELIDNLDFVHLRDRILLVADEMAAREADAAALSVQEVVQFERTQEAPIKTRDDMFRVMQDRLDDIDDSLLRDDSQREIWYLIEDERLMRRALAREFQLARKCIYTVEQEGVTAEEKETDIRLRSVSSDQQGVIELKIGEKGRSAAALAKALREQLFAKYLAPENRRSGILLITTRGENGWRHPSTGQSIDLSGLVSFLNEQAEQIMRDACQTVRIAVHGINLSPRLPTEKNA
jgi:hypothetical protein